MLSTRCAPDLRAHAALGPDRAERRRASHVRRFRHRSARPPPAAAASTAAAADAAVDATAAAAMAAAPAAANDVAMDTGVTVDAHATAGGAGMVVDSAVGVGTAAGAPPPGIKAIHKVGYTLCAPLLLT